MSKKKSKSNRNMLLKKLNIKTFRYAEKPINKSFAIACHAQDEK